jgi:uncharacterized repeat protein (TIGR01451 family)/fimbrial isopeptide formation D2 family protein
MFLPLSARRLAVLSVASLLLSLALFAGWGAKPAAAQPELSIVKSASGLHQGGPNDDAREWRIMARNTGDPIGAGDEVTIVDDIDDDLIFLGMHNVHPDWECELDTGNVLTCTLDSGAQIDDQNETIVLYDACDTLERGSVDNDASIFLDDDEHDTDQANPNVFECEPGDLTLAKGNDAGGTVASGDSFNWLITITVTGGPVTSTIEDAVPAGFTIGGGNVSDNGGAAITCSVNGQDVTCELEDLAPGTYTVTIDVTAPDGDPTGECTDYTNEATVTDGDGEGESDDDTILVICPGEAGLNVVKEGPAEIVSGEEITYTITITNIGDVDAINVVLTDDLPDMLADVAAVFDVNPGAAGGTDDCDVDVDNVVTCEIGTLAESDGNTTGSEPDVAEVTITATVEGCEPLENSASVSFESDETEVSVEAVTTSNTVLTEVLCSSITIIKEVQPGTDPQDFDFNDDIPDCDIGTLDDHSSANIPQSMTCIDLEPGEYEVTENVPNGWVLDSVECTGDTESTIEEVDDGVLITLAGAENITCTFINEEERRPSPTATKTNTPTPTATATNTPPPGFPFEPGRPIIIGGIPDRPTTQPPPVPTFISEQLVSPPSTGEAGLLKARNETSWQNGAVLLLACVASFSLALAVARKARG